VNEARHRRAGQHSPPVHPAADPLPLGRS